VTSVTPFTGPIVQRLLERINPRRSLAAAIGWTLALLFCAGAYLGSLWAGSLARTRLETQTGVLYQQYALHISNALDDNLYDRLQWLRGMADVFAVRAADESVDGKRALLERWKASLPELERMAYADDSGKVVASTGRHGEGGSVAGQRWFVEGTGRGWIGDASPGRSDREDSAATGRPDTAPMIDLSAPVRDADNGLTGVVGARLSWSWATGLETSLTERLKADRPVQSLVVDPQGVVLIGPPALLGLTVELPGHRGPGAVGQLVHAWPDGGPYLAGYAVSDGAGNFPGLGWTVWVREPITTAFAEARALERRIFAGLLLLGVAGASVGVAATVRHTRELAAIARSADAIRRGEASVLVVPAGTDEAARIGNSLRMLVDGLQRERASLEALNAELDARVAARTREVERMSEENKYAAVVRERLRMARELHDTLAHSLMALLTEIRLLRKLVVTNPGALREELANAEAAAQEGLREAREAITALRHSEVRDIGFGASLAQLLKRFEDRKGVFVSFESDPRADALADSRAEALYRIAEEALHNVERHAHATRVEASVRVRNSRPGPGDSAGVLVVSIADDGVGFDTDAALPGHYGLRGMREQAELIGARLDVASPPRLGTRITVEMPL
jgi:signal transduction histidine kinase